MKNDKYKYFRRDISWLSFNYRVLLEAEDKNLPLYDRISFISIYSSNLEEYYKVRVAEHKAIIANERNEEALILSSQKLLEEINITVNRQLEDRVRIYENIIIPELRKNHIIFYQSRNVEPFHKTFIRSFFMEEVYPYLQPVLLDSDKIQYFLRDNRLYIAVRLRSKANPNAPLEYYVVKLPHFRLPRFVQLPEYNGNNYLMYIEDIVKANIDVMFPGYDVESSYCMKISRDADILIKDDSNSSEIIEQVKKKVKKRKIGAVCRFVYDRFMPYDFLNHLIDSFNIKPDELVAGDKHLSMEDLIDLPNPHDAIIKSSKPKPMRIKGLNKKESMFKYVAKRDRLIYYPYFSFDHFIHFLYEAVHDPKTKEIMITQYRVAQNSAVINTLIAAAQNGKSVTVFVEIKARFDEENNLATAELMERSGINIIYSIPKLKVHAKTALVIRRNKLGRVIRSYAYISTGNFNEATARTYSDVALFTCDSLIVKDLYNLFKAFRGNREVEFSRLLVAQFNLIPELDRLIDREIALSEEGKEGRIILKMNALQDKTMINKLYEASEKGVEIDLIVRGICCLVPNQPYSKNIRITRIVDMFLEHARVWYFGNDGSPDIFLGSPDWMKRNLYKRIEAVTPILNNELKAELIDMLQIQLADNSKGCFVNEHLENVFKSSENLTQIRSQEYIYQYLEKKNETFL